MDDGGFAGIVEPVNQARWLLITRAVRSIDRKRTKKTGKRATPQARDRITGVRDLISGILKEEP